MSAHRGGGLPKLLWSLPGELARWAACGGAKRRRLDGHDERWFKRIDAALVGWPGAPVHPPGLSLLDAHLRKRLGSEYAHSMRSPATSRMMAPGCTQTKPRRAALMLVGRGFR
jgi:hypothetical protein